MSRAVKVALIGASATVLAALIVALWPCEERSSNSDILGTHDSQVVINKRPARIR